MATLIPPPAPFGEPLVGRIPLTEAQVHLRDLLAERETAPRCADGDLGRRIAEQRDVVAAEMAAALDASDALRARLRGYAAAGGYEIDNTDVIRESVQ